MKTLLLFSAFVFSLLSHTVSAQQITEDMLPEDGLIISNWLAFGMSYPPFGIDFPDVANNTLLDGSNMPFESLFEAPDFEMHVFENNVFTMVEYGQTFHFEVENNSLVLKKRTSPSHQTHFLPPIVYYTFPMNVGDEVFTIYEIMHIDEDGDTTYFSDSFLFYAKFIGKVPVKTAVRDEEFLVMKYPLGSSMCNPDGSARYSFFREDNILFPLIQWDSCFDYWEEIFPQEALAIDVIDQKNTKVFPNPAENYITVQSGNYIIYSSSMKIVQSGICSNTCRIDVSNLSSGVYFFVTQSGGEVQQFIKQ